MNHTSLILRIAGLIVFSQAAMAEVESVTITHVINNSHSTFTVEGSGQVLPAGQTTTLNCDLSVGALTLKPDNKRDFQLMILQVNDSGLELLRKELTTCIVQERHITQVDLEIIKGLKLPSTYLAPGSTSVPHEIMCRRGENIVEITDYNVLYSGLRSEYIVDIYSAQQCLGQLRATKSSTFPSPFTPGGFCRTTQTASLIPGFKQSGTICSESYSSSNFPNKAPTVIRPYLVYLPYGYFDDPNKLYPLMYHLHGTPSTPEVAVDRVATLLDLMIADQRIVPMICVFPNGNSPVNEFMGLPLDELPEFYQNAIVVNGDSIPSFWADSNQLGYMETDIMDTLFEHIETKYQTMDGKQFRGVNGFSGGGGGHQMVLAHSDRFGSVSSNSGYGVDWQTDIDVMQLMDGVFAQIFTDFGYTETHLSQLDPFDPLVYGLINQMPWMYAVANALAPDVSADYGAYLPIDADGNIDPLVQDEYLAHSASFRAAEYVNEILANKLKIYHDAGSYDFFYNLLLAAPSTYLLFDLLRLGSCYYNYSNENYSQALSAQGIKHEFVSYKGNHNGRSNLQTMSALLFHSAIFSSNENANEERIKLIGKGTVIMDEDATMIVDRGVMIGVETLGTYTKLTDIAWYLKGRSKLQIGTEGRAGGTFQIGNTYDKFDLENDPELNEHSITFNLNINGPDAAFQVNQQGVFGMGAGVQGQVRDVPNYYVINTLSNVTKIGIDVAQGSIQHSQIIPGNDARAGLWAIGPSQQYDFACDQFNGAVYGGGNMVNASDADLLHPSMTEGMFDIQSGANINFATDHAVGTYAGPVSEGIRDIQETAQTQIWFYIFNRPVSVNGFALNGITSIPALNLTTFASHAHLNSLNAQVLSSETSLRDDNKEKLPLVGMTQQQCFDFFKLDTYNDQYKKTAPIAQNNTNEATLVYLDSTLQPEDGDVIVRVPGRDFPELTIGVGNGVAIGAIGIVLNKTEPRELVQVYDLEEHW